MSRTYRGYLLLASAFTLCGLTAWAQVPTSIENANSRFEVAANYNATRANTVPGYIFWMQGGSVQFCGQFTRHWGIAADVSGLHTGLMPHTGVGLDLINVVFGVRYTLASRTGRYRIYGQGLGGISDGINSVFPNASGITSTANGPALLVGGGMDQRLSRHLAYRIIDAAWLRTQLANGTTVVQNDLRLGSGIVFRF